MRAVKGREGGREGGRERGDEGGDPLPYCVRSRSSKLSSLSQPPSALPHCTHLNSSLSARELTPGSVSGPSIVCVLPDPV